MTEYYRHFRNGQLYRLLTFATIEASSSMYKAGSRGDARMWFGSEIYKIAKPDDIFAVVPQDGVIYVLPVSHVDLEFCCTTSLNNPIKRFIIDYYNK